MSDTEDIFQHPLFYTKQRVTKEDYEANSGLKSLQALLFENETPYTVAKRYKDIGNEYWKKSQTAGKEAVEAQEPLYETDFEAYLEAPEEELKAKPDKGTLLKRQKDFYDTALSSYERALELLKQDWTHASDDNKASQVLQAKTVFDELQRLQGGVRELDVAKAEARYLRKQELLEKLHTCGHTVEELLRQQREELTGIESYKASLKNSETDKSEKDENVQAEENKCYASYREKLLKKDEDIAQNDIVNDADKSENDNNDLNKSVTNENTDTEKELYCETIDERIELEMLLYQNIGVLLSSKGENNKAGTNFRKAIKKRAELRELFPGRQISAKPHCLYATLMVKENLFKEAHIAITSCTPPYQNNQHETVNQLTETIELMLSEYQDQVSQANQDIKKKAEKKHQELVNLYTDINIKFGEKKHDLYVVGKPYVEDGDLIIPAALFFKPVYMTEQVECWNCSETLEDYLDYIFLDRPAWDSEGQYNTSTVEVYLEIINEQYVHLNKSTSLIEVLKNKELPGEFLILHIFLADTKEYKDWLNSSKIV